MVEADEYSYQKASGNARQPVSTEDSAYAIFNHPAYQLTPK